MGEEVMSWNRKRRYLQRWEKYQRRCDILSYGRELWFKGRDYDGRWDALWKLTRHKAILRGTPSQELTR